MKAFKKIVGSILILIVLIVVGIGGLLGYKGYRMYETALSEKTVNQMVEEIEAEPNYTKIEALPETYKDAVIAVEDRRFYKHKGVDIIAVLRVVVNAVKNGAITEGGSTITQQLCKNEYFTQNKDVVRKVAEMFMAMKVEKSISKEKVLELYVNSIYFGNNYYGIYEASTGYFQVQPKELTDYQSTMLAGIPNAPSAYALTANPRLASERQAQVVDRMIKNGYLSQKQGQQILSAR